MQFVLKIQVLSPIKMGFYLTSKNKCKSFNLSNMEETFSELNRIKSLASSVSEFGVGLMKLFLQNSFSLSLYKTSSPKVARVARVCLGDLENQILKLPVVLWVNMVGSGFSG